MWELPVLLHHVWTIRPPFGPPFGQPFGPLFGPPYGPPFGRTIWPPKQCGHHSARSCWRLSGAPLCHSAFSAASGQLHQPPPPKVGPWVSFPGAFPATKTNQRLDHGNMFPDRFRRGPRKRSRKPGQQQYMYVAKYRCDGNAYNSDGE